MASPAVPPTVKLAEAKTMTLRDHVINILRLVVKELRSIRADPTMLVLVAYAFSISVNTVATGAVTEATNLSVGIVDEDGSELSRQIATLRPGKLILLEQAEIDRAERAMKRCIQQAHTAEDSADA